jgi:hypothetical protein
VGGHLPVTFEPGVGGERQPSIGGAVAPPFAAEYRAYKGNRLPL